MSNIQVSCLVELHSNFESGHFRHFSHLQKLCGQILTQHEGPQPAMLSKLPVARSALEKNRKTSVPASKTWACHSQVVRLYEPTNNQPYQTMA